MLDFFSLYQESLGLDISRLRSQLLLLKTFSLGSKSVNGLNFLSLGLDVLLSRPELTSIFLMFLKKSIFYQTSQLIDLIVVDRLKPTRFRVTYLLKSVIYNQYLLITLFVPEGAMLSSSITIFLGLNWSEREVWDLFGIFFLNHPDLRRLLTDYGFRGYPLRKDFPLTGFREIFYFDSVKRLKYKKVSLMQEFRNFRRLNPWGPYPRRRKFFS